MIARILNGNPQQQQKQKINEIIPNIRLATAIPLVSSEAAVEGN